MQCIWVNQDIYGAHNVVLAGDIGWGLGSTYSVIQFEDCRGRMQQVYIPETHTPEQVQWVKDLIDEWVIDATVLHLGDFVLGEFIPDPSDNTQRYDVIEFTNEDNMDGGYTVGNELIEVRRLVADLEDNDL